MILAIDQGTSGTTCLVVDAELGVRGRGSRPVETHFPRPGWVEHDPDAIWQGVVEAAADAVADAGITARELQAIGITNQRETTVLWERRSSRPVGRAIVWQDRRTAERCAALPRELVRARTGLVPDPYFSASKLEWLLDRTTLPTTDLAFGTVDSWLIWKLTDGRMHATDHTNASRTMLLDLERLEWDDELLELFSIDRGLLPTLHPSSGVIAEGRILGRTLPIAGVAGDQQAALFGQSCFHPGQAKATYGTGSFVLAHVGTLLGPPPDGLLRTAVAGAPGAPPAFALEGAILASGAAIQWLRDGLGLIRDAADSETLARGVDSSDGVYFVPALTGLGSPHWDPDARGVISGLTRGTTREHIVRAALEAIAFQVADVIEAVPLELEVLRADGGATANRFLMQFQADVLGVPVSRPVVAETTALGAAYAAGLAVGFWRDTDELRAHWNESRRWEPQWTDEQRAAGVKGWKKAVERTLDWVDVE